MRNSDLWLNMIEESIKAMADQSASSEDIPFSHCAKILGALQELIACKDPLLPSRIRQISNKTDNRLFQVILEAVANEIARQRVTA